MKTALFLFASMTSLFTITEAFAAKGLAIKLDVTDNAQTLINTKIRKAAGMPIKNARHHITIGYIEQRLDDADMQKLGEIIVQQLQEKFQLSEGMPIRFTVEEAGQPFGNALALIPSSSSANSLKEINQSVNSIVSTLGYNCNQLTQPNSYTPHMTLSLNKEDAQYVDGLNYAINNLKSSSSKKELFFKLFKFSYTVMK